MKSQSFTKYAPRWLQNENKTTNQATTGNIKLIVGEKRNLINHVKRNHPGEELKYRRVTPQGETIMDVKTSLYDLSLTNTVSVT